MSYSRHQTDRLYVDLTPTSYDIHVFALNANLGPDGNGKFYAVPFTEAGLKASYSH